MPCTLINGHYIDDTKLTGLVHIYRSSPGLMYGNSIFVFLSISEDAGYWVINMRLIHNQIALLYRIMNGVQKESEHAGLSAFIVICFKKFLSMSFRYPSFVFLKAVDCILSHYRSQDCPFWGFRNVCQHDPDRHLRLWIKPFFFFIFQIREF